VAVAVELLPVLDHGNEFEKFDQDRNRHDGEAIPSISKNKRIWVHHGGTLPLGRLGTGGKLRAGGEYRGKSWARVLLETRDHLQISWWYINNHRVPVKVPSASQPPFSFASGTFAGTLDG